MGNYLDDGRKINRFRAAFFSTFIRSNGLDQDGDMWEYTMIYGFAFGLIKSKLKILLTLIRLMLPGNNPVGFIIYIYDSESNCANRNKKP